MRLLPIVLATALLAAGNGQAAPLILCYEDVPQPPWTMPDGTGLNIELLKQAAKLTGETFAFRARPWKRCMEEARTGTVDGLIGAADSPSRRQLSRFPMLPAGTLNPEKAMYEDSVSVFIRVGSKASWDGQELVNPHGTVVVQTGYFVGDLLRLRGQSVKDTVKSAEDGLRMLAAGATDVAVLMGEKSVAMAQTDPRFRGKIDVAPQPFANFSFYLIVSHKSYNANPKRIEAIWNAIRDIRATAEYRALEEKETRRKSRN